MYNRTLFPRNWLHDQRLPYTSGKLKSGASTPTCGRSNATLTVETPLRLTHVISRRIQYSEAPDSVFSRAILNCPGAIPCYTPLPCYTPPYKKGK